MYRFIEDDCRLAGTTTNTTCGPVNGCSCADCHILANPFLFLGTYCRHLPCRMQIRLPYFSCFFAECHSQPAFTSVLTDTAIARCYSHTQVLHCRALWSWPWPWPAAAVFLRTRPCWCWLLPPRAPVYCSKTQTPVPIARGHNTAHCVPPIATYCQLDRRYGV